MLIHHKVTPTFPCFQDESNPGIPSEREAVSTYCRQRGLDMALVLKHWNFYLALSFFRIASIAQVWANACLSYRINLMKVLDCRWNGETIIL